MTGSPLPSGRSESAKSALLALFRPVLLVATALGLTSFVIALTLGDRELPVPAKTFRWQLSGARARSLTSTR